MLLKCVQLIISQMFCPFSTSLILESEKIFNVKSKDVVHECDPEFKVFPVTDVIDIRKRNFLVKYDLSDILLCQLCKKIVTILFVILCQHS